jgi:hypothetical protein
MLPNVARVNLYNNVFMDYVNRESSVYNTEWASGVPGYKGTREFAARSGGRVIAPVAGSSNWVSQKAGGVPAELEGTVRGVDPRMVDFLGGNCRPRHDSPLAGAAKADLPMGRMVPLVPEYEPQRGIPLDLKPAKRRSVTTPSIGPYEVPVDDVRVNGADEALEVVLNLKDAGARFPWQLEFGQALQKARMCAAEGDKDKALQATRMHFILSPDTSSSMKRVADMLREIDGDEIRATAFTDYAMYGPNGLDGLAGTEDDLTDPLAEVPLTIFEKSEDWYRELDAAIEARIIFSSESPAKESFYVTQEAFARINSGEFDEAAAILIEALEKLVTLDEKGREGYDGHAEFQRVQHQIDGVRLGLGAYHRATTGTTKGMNEFVTACINFCAFGPMGPDKELGTEDDLAPPL